MIMGGSWWRTTYSSCLRLALLSGLVTQAATLPSQEVKQMAGMFPAASENGSPPSCGAGHFRWNVKILEDAERFQVQFTCQQQLTMCRQVTRKPFVHEFFDAGPSSAPVKRQILNQSGSDFLLYFLGVFVALFLEIPPAGSHL